MTALAGVRLETSSSLDASVVGAVRDVVARAAAVDGVEAISEAFALALDSPHASVTHTVAYAGGSPSVLGYAVRDDSGSAELVVDPESRRRGVGHALLDALLEGGATGVWAHGDLPAARALAGTAGLVPTRELHVMSRRVQPGDEVDPVLPQGFAVRTFEPGRDEQAWLAVNAAAFASHPEQGSITLADLRDRMSQPWFDAAGFFLVEDTTVTGDDGRHPLAAFHWTKREPGSHNGPGHARDGDEGAGTARPGPARDGDEGAGTSGEVYVVGVHPAYQGRGLAGPLTGLGTAYLARQGVETIELYVDGDNTRALATYRRAGFEDAALHVVYGRVTGAGTVAP
ncbi:mycothiol synthase [Knoellia remsis]|uniref:Mycothiol acetyltransferase n=1 Tax=Knoellia remsis TaxID=407159 RepID=A0A2T0UJC0_9MICO|nr:mycothiol synthase [Knoellia remsis]PRY58041.1 mycothiol synthase [Knoellia remsis]